MEYFNNNQWLTETCLSCGSVNHIFLAEDGHAWECWNCLEVWWLDALAMDTILIENNIEDEDELWDMLVNYHPSIIYLHGHACRNQEQ
jgi:hypothetical protein